MKRNQKQSKFNRLPPGEKQASENSPATLCEDLGAGFYWVDVIQRGEGACRSRVRAHTGQQAIDICRARHPGAILIRLAEAR